MFRNGTVFVVGAGASAEFGMPVGSSLAKKIAQSAVLMNINAPTPTIGDDTFFDTFRRIWRDTVSRAKPLKASNAIANGISTAVSIDAFIDRFAGDQEVALIGKMLIALEIAKAERQSNIHKPTWDAIVSNPTAYHGNSDGIQFRDPDDTWIGQFFRILCDGVTDPRELGRNIAIICFNYDRCIEVYLRRQIAAGYQISAQAAHDIVMGMNIVHPYGTLGTPALEEGQFSEGILSFGHSIDQHSPLEIIASNIRTYTEQEHDPQMIAKIHEWIAHAKVLVFLGFGFNNQNLDLLRISHLDGNGGITPPNVYSTGYGIANQVDSTIKRRILHIYGDELMHSQFVHKVHVEYGQSCSQLFSTHNMNLSSFQRRYFAPGKERTQRVIISSDREQS